MIDVRIIRHRLERMEWVMWIAVLALMTIGVLFILSASVHQPELSMSSLGRKQMMWCAIGVLAALGVAVFDYQEIGRQAWPLYALSLVSLVLVLLVGTRIHGAARWLNIFGIYLQPSELAKIAVIIALARHLGRPGRDLGHPRSLLPVALIAGVPFLLIVIQPDLGTAAVLIPITFVMMFVAGIPFRFLAMLGGAGILMLPFAWFGLGDYQKERILVFFDPSRDPLGAGWNKIQSEIAVGSGGLTGKGLFQGTQNILGFLPRTVAPTDFIFSVIAEEMGFIGSILILTLYSALLLAGMRAALRARDEFGRLLAAGAMTLLFSHVFVNIAMTIGLLPITGLPLPLISYGGSFMVSTMLAIGLVQSVYVRRRRR